jgi:hypothetical protein
VQALRDGLSPTDVARQLDHADAHLVWTTYGRFVPEASDYGKSSGRDLGTDFGGVVSHAMSQREEG